MYRFMSLRESVGRFDMSQADEGRGGVGCWKLLVVVAGIANIGFVLLVSLFLFSDRFFYGVVELVTGRASEFREVYDEMSESSGVEMPADTLTPTVTSTSVFTPTPTSTLTPVPVAVVDVSRLNIRAGPGTGYAIIGKLSAEDEVRIIGQDAGRDWWRVSVGESEHEWLHAGSVTAVNAKSVPIVMDIPRPPTLTPTPFPTFTSTPTPQRCPRNCTEAHRMGMSNMRRDHACYLPRQDGDDDGIACESGRTQSPSPSERTNSPSCPRNCTEAHNMGMSNMGRGHACYLPRLDRDSDGTACEK